MKKSKLFRTLTLAVAAALCMATTTVTAYAGGADPDPVPLPETTEAPAEVPEETEEPTTGGMEPEGVPVTPQGNAALVDDFFGDKQLICASAPLMSSKSCAYTVPVLLIRLAIWLMLTPIFCNSAVCARIGPVSIWTI